MKKSAVSKQAAAAAVFQGAALALLLAAVCAHAQRPPSGARAQPVNCTNITQVLDRCAALASYSHTMASSSYPTSLAELRQACPRHLEGLQCLRQHVRCLQPLTKRAILGFIESRRRHVKLLCSEASREPATHFVEAFACIKRHKRAQFVESELRAIRRIDAILDQSQVRHFQERFRRACCSINSYRQRSLDDMQPECGRPQWLAAVEQAIDSVVGEAVEFACPEAKSSVCASLGQLRLSEGPLNKTLTRAGTELMIVLTAPEAAN